jgi:hypothetical protein
MKVEEIKTAEDILRFIEGCMNDFESGVSSKEETMCLLADLVAHVAQVAVNTKGN